jgi:hypothetical protein
MLAAIEYLVVILGLFQALMNLNEEIVVFPHLVVHGHQASLPWHVGVHRWWVAVVDNPIW